MAAELRPFETIESSNGIGTQEDREEGTGDDKRKAGPFGGKTASEAGKASGERRAALRKQRAKGITKTDLQDVAYALLKQAKQGKAQEAKLLLDYVRLLHGDIALEQGIDAAKRPEDMTEEERKAYRQRIAEELAGSPEQAAGTPPP